MPTEIALRQFRTRLAAVARIRPEDWKKVEARCRRIGLNMAKFREQAAQQARTGAASLAPDDVGHAGSELPIAQDPSHLHQPLKEGPEQGI